MIVYLVDKARIEKAGFGISRTGFGYPCFNLLCRYTLSSHHALMLITAKILVLCIFGNVMAKFDFEIGLTHLKAIAFQLYEPHVQSHYFYMYVD